MKRISLILVAALILTLGIGGSIFADDSAPAVPLDPRDAEDIFVAGFTIKVKPVTAEIVKWPEGEIKAGQTFTLTAVAKNHSSQPQEVIYYFDYSPETPTPLLSGTVAIDYDGKGPQQPKIGYNWGTKVRIGPGDEQILYISLAPASWFPSPSQNGDLQLRLRVIRWLGPRG